jgi:hypothetical protein
MIAAAPHFQSLRWLALDIEWQSRFGRAAAGAAQKKQSFRFLLAGADNILMLSLIGRDQAPWGGNGVGARRPETAIVSPRT